MIELLTLTYPGLLLTSFCLMPHAIAQVTSDNTLSTTVDSASGTDFTIENGDRAGNNLFHSFENFSIPNNGSATFNNALEVENIFSRVTGGNVSNIEGAINAGGNANLLLINPAGIIFGENASLNIGGSFLGTTANSLLFPEGEFSAIAPQSQSLLTINRPIGLKFNNPGSIINRSGTLIDSAVAPIGMEVVPEQSLTLVGGEIQLDGGFLSAAGGKIELGSVAEAAEVSFDFANSDYELDYKAVANFGDILLRDLSRIDVSGLGGGEVQLQGRNIILTGGAKISSNTFGNLSGKDITITATESVQLLGVTDVANLFEPLEAASGFLVPLRSSITSNTFNTGDAGDIKINTQRLILENGGYVTASTVSRFDVLSSSPGEGGNIEINASETVEVRNAVEVNTTERAEENLFGLGRVAIEANGVSNIITITVNAAKAGNLTINTGKLTVADGGTIGASSFADGTGGTVLINAAESIDVLGISPIGVFPSAIGSTAVTTGTSGDIRINTEQLNVRSGGAIDVRTSGTGRAGNLEIDIRNLLLDDGALNASTQSGDEGNINVNNAETILLRNNAQITTNATELATGGDINLDAEAIAVFNNSNITAIAEAGQGGNIQITTQGLFIEPDSEITAASNLGIDGTITFNTPDVDPTSGIIELPSVPIDADAILAQDLCRVQNETVAGGSSFVVTGRGGLTPTSADSLSKIDRVVNWTDEADVEVSSDGAIAVKKQSPDKLPNKNRSVIQSQGLMVAADGSLWLTANTDNTTPQNSNNHPGC